MIVWIISNSKITFPDANYLTGNRPLTCKLITKRQRRSNTRIYVSCCVTGRKYGLRIERIRHAPRFMKTHSITIRLKNNGYPGEDSWRNVTLELFSVGEKVYLKTKKRAYKKILPFATQSHRASSNLKNIQMGKWNFKTNPYYHSARVPKYPYRN